MSEIETPTTESRGPRLESRRSVPGTLALIAETLDSNTGTPAETPNPDDRDPSPESRVSALVTAETPAETRTETPAKPNGRRRYQHGRRHAKVIVVKHKGLRRPKSAAAAGKTDDPTPRSVRFIAGPALGALTLIVAVMASVGQKMFAESEGAVGVIGFRAKGEPGHFDFTPWFAPAVFDLSVAALLNLGMSAAYRNRSPWPYWIVAFSLGGFSIFTNTQHPGAIVFAGASAVLMVVWFLKLYGRYVELEIAARRRAGARPQLVLSGLMLAAPRTAVRAQIIATRKPLSPRVAELVAAGRDTNERDLAIRMSDLWLTIFDDRRATEYNEAKLKLWNRGKRRAARRKAALTAWREVDRRLGLDVVELSGIELGEITYVAPAPEPAAVVAPPAVVAPTRPATPPARRTPRDGTDLMNRTVEMKVHQVAPTSPAPGKPTVSIDTVPGIPPVHDQDLRERVIKDLHHVVTIINHPDYKDVWHSRAEKIEKPDIKAATGMPGSGVQQRLMTLMNDLRALPMTSGTTA
jgi:hypothetical protein